MASDNVKKIQDCYIMHFALTSLRKVVLNICSWRPKKLNETHLGDPYSAKILLNTGFGDPKMSAREAATQKWIATRLLRNIEF